MDPAAQFDSTRETYQAPDIVSMDWQLVSGGTGQASPTIDLKGLI